MPQTVDPGDRWLRRVFNNGHTDFRHGGRLAGGFWMDLPKALRRRAISIGGEPVAELDYRAMMPRLLYASVGHVKSPMLVTVCHRPSHCIDRRLCSYGPVGRGSAISSADARWPSIEDSNAQTHRSTVAHFRSRHIAGAHSDAQLPGDDVAREVIQHGREVEPGPADDLEVREIGLPELVGRRCLVLELVGGLDHHEG